MGSKKAQEKKQKKQAEKRKDYGCNVTPSLKLIYNDNQGTKYGVQLSNEKRTVTALSGDGFRYVTSSEPLSQDYFSLWKVKIEQLKGHGLIGLIGTLQSSHCSHRCETCYSWAYFGAYIGGHYNSQYGDWKYFESGDEIFFKYEPKSKTLTMKVRRLRKDQTFILK